MRSLSQTAVYAGVLAILAGIAGVPTPVHAQTGAFKVGDTVQFNFGALPQQRLGVVVTAPKETAVNLVQLEVRELPSLDYPQGHGEAWVDVKFVHRLSAANVTATTLKPLEWFMGRWVITIVAPTVDRAKSDGYIYRREEFGARMGFVEINPNGTFTWKVLPSDPASAWIHGRWRAATANEPGARVVLLGGEGQSDWVVYGSSTKVGGRDGIQMRGTRLNTYRLGTRG